MGAENGVEKGVGDFDGGIGCNVGVGTGSCAPV